MKSELRSRFELAPILLVFPLILVASGAQRPFTGQLLDPSIQAKVDLLALHAAQRIREARLDVPEPKVLVVDFFRNTPGSSSELGTVLADRFSESLSGYSAGLRILDRRTLKDYLLQEWTSLEDLQSSDICFRMGRQVGATEVILGTLYEDNGYIRLTMRLEGFGATPKDTDPLQVTDESVRFPSSEELHNSLFRRGPDYTRTPDKIPQEPGVVRSGERGVSQPECILCESPSYSDAAQAAKVQGTVTLSIVVTAQGETAAVYVLKGAPFGLTAKAIEVVKTWRFAPAQKDGQPVATRVPVEITFRLN